MNTKLERYVREKMEESWSPEQIAGRWKRETGDTLSPDTVYKYLYSYQGKPWRMYLRYKHARKTKKVAVKDKRWGIQNRVFIDQRPAIIGQRKQYGDFEGDTLGKPHREPQTLVGVIERKSRYILARKVDRLGNTIEGFQELLAHAAAHSLTIDNGFENARHEEIGIPVYFCHPYSSWEKGQIENAFGLLREYIPKRQSIRSYTNEDIQVIVTTINQRPRKCLGFRTPKEVFEENVLQTNTS